MDDRLFASGRHTGRECPRQGVIPRIVDRAESRLSGTLTGHQRRSTSAAREREQAPSQVRPGRGHLALERGGMLAGSLCEESRRRLGRTFESEAGELRSVRRPRPGVPVRGLPRVALARPAPPTNALSTLRSRGYRQDGLAAVVPCSWDIGLARSAWRHPRRRRPNSAWLARAAISLCTQRSSGCRQDGLAAVVPCSWHIGAVSTW
jgi:hypothetical protein